MDFQLCGFGRWLEFDLTGLLLSGDRRGAGQKVGHAVCVDWNESDCDLPALGASWNSTQIAERVLGRFDRRLGEWNGVPGWVPLVVGGGRNDLDPLVVPDPLQTKDLFPDLGKMRGCPECGFPIDHFGVNHCPKCDGPAPREIREGMS